MGGGEQGLRFKMSRGEEQPSNASSLRGAIVGGRAAAAAMIIVSTFVAVGGGAGEMTSDVRPV